MESKRLSPAGAIRNTAVLLPHLLSATVGLLLLSAPRASAQSARPEKEEVVRTYDGHVLTGRLALDLRDDTFRVEEATSGDRHFGWVESVRLGDVVLFQGDHALPAESEHLRGLRFEAEESGLGLALPTEAWIPLAVGPYYLNAVRRDAAGSVEGRLEVHFAAWAYAAPGEAPARQALAKLRESNRFEPVPLEIRHRLPPSAQIRESAATLDGEPAVRFEIEGTELGTGKPLRFARVVRASGYSIPFVEVFAAGPSIGGVFSEAERALESFRYKDRPPSTGPPGDERKPRGRREGPLSDTPAPPGPAKISLRSDRLGFELRAPPEGWEPTVVGGSIHLEKREGRAGEGTIRGDFRVGPLRPGFTPAATPKTLAEWHLRASRAEFGDPPPKTEVRPATVAGEKGLEIRVESDRADFWRRIARVYLIDRKPWTTVVVLSVSGPQGTRTDRTFEEAERILRGIRWFAPAAPATRPASRPREKGS